jgi:hypothetical protein
MVQVKTLPQRTALAADHRHPERDETHAAERDVQRDEGEERGRHQRFHA